MKWRIYYDDGTTFDDTQGMPHDAPAWGVLAIITPDELVGRSILHRWDYYYWDVPHQQWWGGDLIGVIDQFSHRPRDVTALKVGRNVSNEIFTRVMELAVNDPDFPVRSGQRNGERP